MIKKLLSKKTAFFFVLSSFLLLGATKIALAQANFGEGYAENTNLGNTDPRTILVNLVNIGFTFLSIIAVIMIIYAGFLWMTSGGNQEKVDKAKKILIGAVIGLIIILSAFAIVTFVLNEVGGAMDGGGSGSGSGGGGGLPGGGGGGDAVSCDGNSLTPVCDADDSMCASDEYCDSSSCTCQDLGAAGADCNTTTTPDVCLPDDSLCISNVCETPGCTCADSPIINSISPVGGFCNENPDTPCSGDDDCDSGTCNLDTPNGMPGNLISISGHYFGTTTGDVYFNGAVSGTTTADLANAANPNCSDTWNENQIIVEVPSGIDSTSSIKVERTDGLTDTSDNLIGPEIPDFRRNNIERPGLCGINPGDGQIGDSLTYQGVNLTDSNAYMGAYRRYIEAYNSGLSGPLSGTAEVPSIAEGDTSTFASSSGIYSNYLDFVKEEEPYSGPYISSFSPTSGPGGQYVTIEGSGFGKKRGGSTVYFGTSTYANREGNFDFPDVCGDSFWSDKQVIVKVPDGASISDRTIYMDIQGFGMIDTSGGAVSPSTFSITSGDPDPGICNVSPAMGSNGAEVSIWGEYFGAAADTVRFYNNNDQTGGDIGFWGGAGDAERVDTTVHEDAISGPLNVMRGGVLSNDWNFQVGLCTDTANPDDACGSDVCCPTGTYKEGRCATSTDDCYVDIPSSVFEWEFDTGVGTTSIDDSVYDSCQERSLDTGTCSSTLMCPNKPGQCSFNESGVTTELGQCGDSYCDSIEPCATEGCEYATSSSGLDHCLSSPLNSCDISTTTSFSTEVECRDVDGDGNGDWYYDTYGSCSGSYVVAPDGGCVDYNSCDICDNDFDCVNDNDDDGEGYCGISDRVCPDGAACDSGTCSQTSPSICECCCRIGNEEKDCCSFVDPVSGSTETLTCAGTCGGDTTDDDAGYGRCTGCRVEDAAGNVDQELSDEACVCEGSSGSFCDVNAGPDLNNDGNPDGVCKDCSLLSSEPYTCSDHHSTCCVDATDSDECRGGEGNMSLGTDPDIGYCEYYQCDTVNPSVCDTGTPVASSTDQVWSSTSTCVSECGSGSSALGESCSKDATTTCNTAICGSPFECITDTGAIPGDSGYGYPSDCGYCCCTPGEGDCASLGTGLNCQANQSPCDGSNRGLCCGCESDNDCGTPASIGCGVDTCCHSRPEVASTTPVDGDSGICTNAQISATFNTEMSLSSFTGNMIVVGEYSGTCPEGTNYLAQKDQSNNIFARIYENIKEKLSYTWYKVASIFTNNAIASPSPSAAMNYCAVPGSVDGHNNASGNAVITFTPNNILDTDTKYFAIVKGDENLDSSTGVSSYFRIGINASGYSEVTHDSEFNGVNYPNSFIWSFTTMEDQGTSGVCAIESADITPGSYLFKTNEESLSEDDDDPNDDSESSGGYDRDKFFKAQAKTSDGQILAPIPGVYEWEWSWSVDNNNIVDITSLFPVANDQQEIEVQDGVNNNNTKVRAEVTNVSGSESYGGAGREGVSDVWVFLCNNPWPPFSGAGTWEPWRDSIEGVSPCVSGTCINTNYEIYYCRDRGNNEMTADDLPSILSDETINRGSSTDIVKESYFFREIAPDVSGSSYLSVAGTPSTGGGVRLDWSQATSTETLTKYKIYYGTSEGGPYNKYEEVSEANAPYNAAPYLVEELENGQKYCFAVTAIHEDGSESDYSNEVCATPEDTTPPSDPAVNTVTPANERAYVPWQDTSAGDAVMFRIYYKADSTCAGTVNFGNYVEEPYRGDATTTIEDLANGTEYCFGVSALDEFNNESNITLSPNTPAPFADIENFAAGEIGTTSVTLRWDYTDESGAGIDNQTVYYGTSTGSYIWQVDVYPGTEIDINGLSNNTDYYFNIKSKRGTFENPYAGEIDITTLP